MGTATQLSRYAIERIEQLGGVAFNLITAGTAGHADVIGCLKGLHVELEVKIGRDRLSPVQYARLSRVIQAGGWAFIVRSKEDVDHALSLVMAGLPCPPLPESEMPKEMPL